MTAIRTQRNRKTKPGIPVGSVYVGRPSIWGNPYKFGNYNLGQLIDSNMTACNLYYADLKFQARYHPHKFSDNIKKLIDKSLCCWCAPHHTCHADILIALAAHLKDILLSPDYGTLIPQSVESWPKISDIYSAH